MRAERAPWAYMHAERAFSVRLKRGNDKLRSPSAHVMPGTPLPTRTAMSTLTPSPPSVRQPKQDWLERRLSKSCQDEGNITQKPGRDNPLAVLDVVMHGNALVEDSLKRLFIALIPSFCAYTVWPSKDDLVGQFDGVDFGGEVARGVAGARHEPSDADADGRTLRCRPKK